MRICRKPQGALQLQRVKQERTVRIQTSTWLVLTLLGTACAQTPTEPQPRGLAIQFATLSGAGGCTQTTNGKGTLPQAEGETVARLKVKWTAEDRSDLKDADRTGEASISSADIAKTGSWLIPNLPTSTHLRLEVFGCSADAKVVWYGKAADYTVKDGEETTARVFMTAPGKSSCTGNAGTGATLQAGRAFSGGTTLAGGNAVVVGGAAAWQNNIASASTKVDLYDYRQGTWTPGPNLLAPRIFPTVVALDATHVLVAGGVLKLQQISQKLPLALFAPDDVSTAGRPPVAAEILTLSDSAGTTVPSTLNPGVGTLPLSRGILAGKSLLFAGGLDEQGAAVKQATRINVTDLAKLQPGTTETLQLLAARVQPVLVSYADGTAIVWGGQTEKGALAGEILAVDAANGQTLTVQNSDDIVNDPNFATIGATSVVLQETGDKLVFLVTGGAPVNALWTTATPSYVVSVDRKQATATCVRVQGDVLAGGLGVTAALVGTHHLLISGGLLSLSALSSSQDPPPAHCQDPALTKTGCILGGIQLFELPTDVAATPFVLKPVALPSGATLGPHFGALALPLPVGTLLAGGMTVAVNLPDGASEIFDAAAQIVTTPFANSDDCKL